jgi:hypothetical protein
MQNLDLRKECHECKWGIIFQGVGKAIGEGSEEVNIIKILFMHIGNRLMKPIKI